MSEAETSFFEPSFNRSIKIRARDQRLTSDAGVLLLREVDQRLGLTASLSEKLVDPRHPKKIRYTLTELLRERIYSRAQGYSATDDLDRLAHDPALKMATWDRPGNRVLQERMASQPTHSRLTDTVAGSKQNLEALRGALSDWVERHLRASGGDHAVRRGTLDIDSFPVTVYGSQPGAAFNGYYKEKIYLPLVAGFAPGGNYDSKRLGDGFVHAILRAGNADSAAGAVRFSREALRRSKGLARSLDLRMDAAFMEGEIMDPLTEDGVRFVGRLKSNPVLEKLAAPYLTRSVGRPPKDGYEYALDLGEYRAESWRHAQRLILVIVDLPDPKTGQLDLFPFHFFLVTSWKWDEMSAWDLLDHYRRRGTFEDRIGELAQAVAPHLSSPSFQENEAELLFSILCYNLLSMVRGELEVMAPEGWDLRRLQNTVLKAGGRITKAGRRLFVDLAMAVVPLWRLIVERIGRWRLPAGRFSQPGPRKRAWIPPPRHAHLQAVLRL